MTGLLAHPDQVAAVRTYVPLLRRLRSAGWEHVSTEIVTDNGRGRRIVVALDHSWWRGNGARRDKVTLTDVGNVLIRPASAPEWALPIIAADRLATVLEVAGVIPPAPQPTADMVARRTIRALRARGWRPPRDEDDDYARDELYPQPGDPPGQMPPHAHGYPVGGRAPHVSGEHNWRDCPDLSEPYAAPGDGAL